MIADTKKLLDKLGRWVRVIQNSFLVVKLFEVFIVVAIGYATEKATSPDAKPVWSAVLIVAAIVYLIISLIQTAYNYYFPSNIVDELTARLELEKIQKRLSRKTEIYDYLTQAIGDLNNQTCHIIGGSVDHLCDTGIKDNITNVASPLFENTNYIFECNKTEYTIGLYLNHYLQQPIGLKPPIDLYGQLQQKGIIFLKDDLRLSDELGKDLVQDAKASGFRQQVKQAIEASLNNNCYCFSHIDTKNPELCIFCVEVQEVCEDFETRGVLFVIAEKINEPEDIEQILRIFSKIISNLLSRQDECIVNQVEQKNEEFRRKITRVGVPPEVVDLEEQQKKENGTTQH